jgi:hypothetical protein
MVINARLSIVKDSAEGGGKSEITKESTHDLAVQRICPLLLVGRGRPDGGCRRTGPPPGLWENSTRCVWLQQQLPESIGFAIQAVLMLVSAVLILLGIVATFTAEEP